MHWAARGLGLALGVGAVALLAIVAARAAHVLLLVFLGVLLAAALEPTVTWAGKRLPLSRVQAIGAVYLGFLALVVVTMLVVVPAAVAEAERVAERLPVVLDDATTWAASLQPAFVADTLTRLLATAGGMATRASAPPDTRAVVEAGMTVAEALVTVVTLLVVVAFWLVERPRLQRYALAFWPASRRGGARGAWNRIEDRLGRWARGQLVLMAAVGAASGVAYAFLGLPSALLLGLIAGLCEAIPLVGPLAGAIPALLVAATVSPETALAVAVVSVLIQFVEGNVLVPMVMRNAVALSPLLVLLSLLVGAAVAGLAGALIAVPVMAAIEVVLEPFQARSVPVAIDPQPEDPDEAGGEGAGPGGPRVLQGHPADAGGGA